MNLKMPVQFEKRKEIAAAWHEKRKLNPKLRCYHPIIEKEYYCDLPTGDYLCIECGEAFMAEERCLIEHHCYESYQ